MFLGKDISAGIECLIDIDGKKLFNFVLLQRKKNIISIINRGKSIENLEDLFEFVNSNIHISIVISGKGFIFKKIAIDKSNSWQEVLDKCFPNADVNEFYIQTIDTNEEGECFAAVIRKSIIDDLVSKFNETSRLVTNLYLGPFCLHGLALVFGKEDRTLEVRNYRVSFKNEKLFHISLLPDSKKLSNDKFKLGDDYLEEELILAYSAAFEQLAGESFVRSNIFFLERNGSEFKLKKKYLLIVKSLAAVLLAGLIVNFIYFRNYSNEKYQLDDKLKTNSEAISSVSMLRNVLEEKQKLLKNAGILTSNKFSYYIDQLAYDVPKEITFTEVSLNPVNKINDSEGDIEFMKNLILIRGICDGSDLNYWVNLLRKKKWIRGIEIVNYEKNKSTGNGEFELQLKY